VSSIDDNGKPILKFSEMFAPTQEEDLVTHISALRKGILIVSIFLYVSHFRYCIIVSFIIITFQMFIRQIEEITRENETRY
jgi:hypothetical protein